MIVDAHQHFWQLARGDYRFPRADDATLYRDFLPGDLVPLLNDVGVDRTILIQATDTFAETQFLLGIAAANPFVAGVVGWWDPRSEGGIEEVRRLAGDQRLAGVRLMLQGLDDISFLLTEQSRQQFEQLVDLRLVCDLLVDPRQLRAAGELVRQMPRLGFVINHMAKPWRTPGQLDQWHKDMAALAALPNVAVKVSGYPVNTPPPSGEADDVLVGRLRSLFGVERLLWGSDWPVAEREGGYRVVFERMRKLFTDFEFDAVFGSNAARIYRLPPA